jgi:putative membrane protein insertion efficiency factor
VVSQSTAIAASLTRSAVIIVIDIYRAVLSPLITATIGPACRFEPTCSEYAREAICRHGIVAGGRLALGRLLRCRPAGGWGPDPIPQVPVSQDRLPKNRDARTARALT